MIKKRFNLNSIMLIILFSMALVNCKKKDKKVDEDPKDVFDKQAMLVNMADNLIVPSYTSFKVAIDSLNQSFLNFKASNSLLDFQNVRQKFNVAYLKYQRCDLFEFGPAETAIVRSNYNVFPTDTIQILANIGSGVYDLNLISNIDAKGLPALEYLFYGNGLSELDVVATFTNSVNRKQYVTDLLNEMVTKTNAIINSWNSSYRNTFVNSLGTDVGSSIGYLVNQLNFELDYLKNAKIGTPLGKKTLGIPVPGSCEAIYTSRSVQYALETLNLIESVYLGRTITGSNEKGFDDYLTHLDVKYNSGTLNDAIIAQFTVAKSKLNQIQDPLASAVINNATVVDAAYVELVKLLVLLKTDMPSSLGVIITYQDGDGD